MKKSRVNVGSVRRSPGNLGAWAWLLTSVLKAGSPTALPGSGSATSGLPYVVMGPEVFMGT